MCQPWISVIVNMDFQWSYIMLYDSYWIYFIPVTGIPGSELCTEYCKLKVFCYVETFWAEPISQISSVVLNSFSGVVYDLVLDLVLSSLLVFLHLQLKNYTKKLAGRRHRGKDYSQLAESERLSVGLAAKVCANHLHQSLTFILIYC